MTTQNRLGTNHPLTQIESLLIAATNILYSDIARDSPRRASLDSAIDEALGLGIFKEIIDGCKDSRKTFNDAPNPVACGAPRGTSWKCFWWCSMVGNGDRDRDYVSDRA